jgi:hypothetical protein
MKLLRPLPNFVGAAILLASCLTAYADTRVEQVWTCTLNDGKTLDDLNAVHSKWLAWANKQKYGGDIHGYVAASMVSAGIDTVLIIDSYPDLKTLTADWDAYNNSSDGRTLEADYEAAATCTSNSLFMVMKSDTG